MGQQTKHMSNEPDIGSGEKSRGQQDTEKMIEQVGNSEGQKRPASDKQKPDRDQRNAVPGKGS